MGGASYFSEVQLKPSLSFEEQVSLLVERKLDVADEAAAAIFLRVNSYYRFSGYMRYFQEAPHYGDDTFVSGSSFDTIRGIYEADAVLRDALVRPMAQVEQLLRTTTAHVISLMHGPYGCYLEDEYYADAPDSEPTVDVCMRDIKRSKERHILRFKNSGAVPADYSKLPVWSAVESWSFGTLSKCIERGAQGTLPDSIASMIGVGREGFASRVRALVYLRNRVAHHSRLWHHSIIDAGPTPNAARGKAKRVVGQFEPRSVLDVIVSMDNILLRSGAGLPVLPELFREYGSNKEFWRGLTHPTNPRDHVRD